MKATLVRVLREMDNDRFSKDLATYFKDVDLIIEPQQGMRIKVGQIKFYIETITQDLNSGIIILHEFIDIHYRHNRNDEGFKTEREILSNDGWKLL